MWFWLVAVWVGCGILDYGFTFAYLQRRWPDIAEEWYHRDMMFALWGSIFGPIGLLVTIRHGWTRYGLKFW